MAFPKTSIALDIEPLLEVVQRHAALRPQAIRELRKDLLETAARAARQAPVPTPAAVLPPGDEVLTTQQAADLLGVSRPFLAARIDAGEIPLFQQVGNQRRVLASAVRAWHERSRGLRRQAMAELARDIEDEHRPED